MNTDKLFLASDGTLYKCQGNIMQELRARFSWHHREITRGSELCATLRAGPFAWPGGYQLALLLSDGEALCFDCARTELRQIVNAIRTRDNSGWRVVGLINCAESDSGISCAHCDAELQAEPEPDDNAQALQEACQALLAQIDALRATVRDSVRLQWLQRLAGNVRKLANDY